MKQVLAIRSLSRKEFDAFAPVRTVVATMLMDEVAWFADDHDVVIGLVARDKADNDYSAFVLGPDGRGKFRAIDVVTGLDNQSEARSQLVMRMEGALASGGKPFPDQA